MVSLEKERESMQKLYGEKQKTIEKRAIEQKEKLKVNNVKNDERRDFAKRM